MSQRSAGASKAAAVAANAGAPSGPVRGAQADGQLAGEELDRFLLGALLDSTTDQIYFKDRESRFIKISTALALKLGLATPRDAIGKTDFDVFSEEHARRAFEDEQRIIDGGEPVVGIKEKETWENGREAWVSTSKLPLRDESDAIIGTFGVSRDVTLEKLQRDEINLQAERLQRALAYAEKTQRNLQAALVELHRVSPPSPRERADALLDDAARCLRTRPRTARPSAAATLWRPGRSPARSRAAASELGEVRRHVLPWKWISMLCVLIMSEKGRRS